MAVFRAVGIHTEAAELAWWLDSGVDKE